MTFEEFLREKYGNSYFSDNLILDAEEWHSQDMEEFKKELPSKEDIEKIIMDMFRQEFFPLYPIDKSLSEMTSYEQGLYKSKFAEAKYLAASLRARMEGK